MNDPIIERACLFGTNESLFGILSTPAQTGSARGPTIVILNTGTTHRVGHHRMSVSLARALAAQGYPAFRFDFAGVGDSRPSDSGAPLLESNLADIRSALDWLTTTLHSSCFVLLGLCSGADYAVMYSHTDARVVGLVLLDPFVPKTPRYVIGYMRSRFANPRSLLRFRPGKSVLVRALFPSTLGPRGEAAELGHISFHGQNPRKTLQAIYERNIATGMQILVFCTALPSSPRHTYEGQFAEAFKVAKFGDQLRVKLLRDCDHMFSSPSNRDILGEATIGWMTSAMFRSSASSIEGANNPTQESSMA